MAAPPFIERCLLEGRGSIARAIDSHIATFSITVPSDIAAPEVARILQRFAFIAAVGQPRNGVENLTLGTGDGNRCSQACFRSRDAVSRHSRFPPAPRRSRALTRLSQMRIDRTGSFGIRLARCAIRTQVALRWMGTWARSRQERPSISFRPIYLSSVCKPFEEDLIIRALSGIGALDRDGELLKEAFAPGLRQPTLLRH